MNVITFDDFMSSGLLSNVGVITPLDMLLIAGMSLLLGIWIRFVYTRTHIGPMYSFGFGLSLIFITIITAVLMLTISSRLGLSLGMVGALSIVRFRTAIKEPLELMFLFWAVETGIVLSAGMPLIGGAVNLVIGLLIWIFSSMGARTRRPYILTAVFISPKSPKTGNKNIRKYSNAISGELQKLIYAKTGIDPQLVASNMQTDENTITFEVNYQIYPKQNTKIDELAAALESKAVLTPAASGEAENPDENSGETFDLTPKQSGQNDILWSLHSYSLVEYNGDYM